MKDHRFCWLNPNDIPIKSVNFPIGGSSHLESG